MMEQREKHKHLKEEGCGGHCGHEEQEGGVTKKEILIFAIGLLIFAAAFLPILPHWASLCLYVLAYLVIGREVLGNSFANLRKGEVFDENFLMMIATVGAFAIGEYPEAVAVMIFYQIGELFQEYAVQRSRGSITALMDIRPDYANLLKDGKEQRVSPEQVEVGAHILIKPGEKIPLDGVITKGDTFVDTSALTGESLPQELHRGDPVLSGCINQSGVIEVCVEKTFGQSTVSKILDLVENASSKKAATEHFISRFAHYYTPAVVLVALLVAVVPPFVLHQSFEHWIYTALTFLVISCPCALVVSIPLGFFGGIGVASKHGILIKGGNDVEALHQIGTVVFDKTGTLTQGVFAVERIQPANGFTQQEVLYHAAYAESQSSHPIAQSIVAAYPQPIDRTKLDAYEELSGRGIRAQLHGKTVLAGSRALLVLNDIACGEDEGESSAVYIAVDGVYAGAIAISDQPKADAKSAIDRLHQHGIHTIMLTGDRKAAAQHTARLLGVDQVEAELLPQDKVERLERIIADSHGKKVAFVGDGINDAPVLARADIGIAMGNLGSDAAIEAADVVLMKDSPASIVTAIEIADETKRIVWQNIIFAIGVKLIILVLGLLGIASMWAAVFADVGVALIAILNAVRILRKKF